MQKKDQVKDILFIVIVIFVNVITVYFIHWVYEGFFPKKITHVLDIIFYVAVVTSLLIYNITYVTKLYIIAKNNEIQCTNKHQMWFKRTKIINLISLILLSSAVLYGTHLRGSCFGCGNTLSCPKVETDAVNTLAAISSYFSEPGRTQLPTLDKLIKTENLRLNTGRDAVSIEGDLDYAVWVTVKDTIGRCPRGDYFTANMGGDFLGYWY